MLSWIGLVKCGWVSVVVGVVDVSWDGFVCLV